MPAKIINRSSCRPRARQLIATSSISARSPCSLRKIAPTTPLERVEKIATYAKGFLYYVSREGVTGVHETVASSLGEKMAQLREISDLPIAVGFGISNADQAREVARHADAVVVGSAIVDLIAKHGNSGELIEKVGSFARELRKGIK